MQTWSHRALVTTLWLCCGLRIAWPSVLLAADLGDGTDPDSPAECCVKVTLREVSGDGTRTAAAGMIRASRRDGSRIPLADLLNRGTGLVAETEDTEESRRNGIHSWWVIPGEAAVVLPQETVILEGFSGLETEVGRIVLELAGQSTAEVDLPLVSFSDLRAEGLRSANTHLHIMKLTRAESDRYLTEVPLADRLDALFVSHLERAVADQTYITNRYTRSDLDTLARRTGILFGWGEEHRHNMTDYGEGYGHVMLLNIPELIRPVSIGRGIMKQGTDGIPLARGIRLARRDGGTIVWCHNEWGRESLPNLFHGHVDAVNIFDGSARSSYSDSFYQFLNAGLHVPFSTGTDWCQYDFSRVYVPVGDDFTIASWLKQLSGGRSFITNGPLLEFRVNDCQAGDTVSLADGRRTVTVEGRARGRVDFGRLELVMNGEVIAAQPAGAAGGHFEAELGQVVSVAGPGWLALRTPPPSVPDDPNPARQVKTARNEYGQELFSHTSPVYIEWNGRRHFDVLVARKLLGKMKSSHDEIDENCLFADAHERAHVLDIYASAIADLEKQIEAQQQQRPAF